MQFEKESVQKKEPSTEREVAEKTRMGTGAEGGGVVFENIRGDEMDCSSWSTYVHTWQLGSKKLRNQLTGESMSKTTKKKNPKEKLLIRSINDEIFFDF